ncbi:MAG: hypothetical protein KBF88_04430 [Polyangiaceae bacterium]|nr:hypothetical protein [Polyangiaceae bacterium]
MKLSKLSIALGSLAVLSGAIVVACTGDDFPSTPTADSGADVTTTDARIDGTVDDSGADVKAPELKLGRMDRAGQPGVAYLLGTQADASLRAEFNGNAPFSTPENLTAAFHAALVKLDNSDTVNSWNAGPAEGTVTQVPQDAGPDADGGTKAVRSYPHPLVGHVSTNALMVDSSKPFSATGYFDVELKAIQGAPGTHTTCGGRWLGEDVADKMLSLVIKGTTTGVSDGVSAPSKAPTLTFPYLAAP